MQRRKFVKFAAAFGAAGAVPAWAQQAGKFPSKPIKFVVPFSAGGGGDTVARMLAQRLSERTNNPVVVENRTGAGGNIGTDFVLKSPPDGYTLLNMSSTYPIQAAVSKLPFDPIGDMQPIIMVSRDPVILMVHPDSPLKTAKDLIDAAKKTPGKITHGSAGVGSIAHLGMEELAFLMGVELLHVPYKGSSQAFSDLLGNNVQLMLSSATFSQPYIKSGRVRALGIAGMQRIPQLPDVPTFEEQGVKGYNVVDWKAVAGPKGIPPDVVAYLNAELNAVLKHKSVADKFEAEGTTAVGGTPEQMMQVVRSDIERWKSVAEKAKVKIE
jgi:tripartite-type tricarboxylate transporter receptor subunit TctC